MSMLRVFIGYDPRSSISYHVAQASFLMASLSKPISITPLDIATLPIQRMGITPFTFTRFLVPWLCDYQGWALFVDADVACVQDPAELFAQADDRYAVMAVNTKPFLERAAVMLFNCGHPDNKILTPEYIETAKKLHHLSWTQNIGWVDKKWNHLVGYDAPNPNPAIIHYTMGVPCFKETLDSEHAERWQTIHQQMNSTQPWYSIMGSSVHNVPGSDGRPVPRYKVFPPGPNGFEHDNYGANHAA